MNRILSVGATLALLALSYGALPDRAAAQSSVEAMLKKDYVGLWNKSDDIGWRSVISLNADGTCSNANGRFATWDLEHNELLIRYDATRDGFNRFALPPHNGVLTGKTDKGKPRTMALRTVSAPAATYAAMTGAWEYFNHVNGHRAIVTLAADGTVVEDGRFMATWLIENNRLYYSYVEHHDWVDSYPLPPKGGVLYSDKGNLTMTQQKTAPAASPVTVATVQPTGTGSPATSDASGAGGGYFGARDGAAPVATGGGAATPLPSIAALPSATPPPAGRFAGGGPVAGVATTAPTPATTVAATPAPTSAAKTPAGKWHWHAGEDKQLTDKGAILEGYRVVGQWKWLDQKQGKIQVQWIGSGPRRAPMNYTLSEHGNHLTGTSPESGNEHTEDRVE